jgi:ketosteroid isomerase-like protein
VAPALSQADDEYDGVRSLILKALEVIRSDNFDAYFDLFTEDAVWMMPSSYADVDKTKARSFYGFTRKFRFDQAISVDELVVADDWAFVRISFDGYLRAKLDGAAPPLRSVSRHIWILQRQRDGAWKIARDIWNNPREVGESPVKLYGGL